MEYIELYLSCKVFCQELLLGGEQSRQQIENHAGILAVPLPPGPFRLAPALIDNLALLRRRNAIRRRELISDLF
jgi:hypothetical protein